MKTFGVSWDPSIRRSKDWHCPNCDYFIILDRDNWKYVVGLQSAEGMPRSISGNPMPAIAIIECPKCFEKCWLHVLLQFVEIFFKMKEKKSASE